MKVLKRIAPFAIILAAALLLLYLPDIGPERYSDLANFFRVEMKRQGYAGFSVAAISDGSVLYVDGFGKDGSGAAIGPDTALYAPAAAKSMAALAALSLVQEGRIALDAPVSAYLPWFDRALGGLTLRHLLSHTTGFSDSNFDDAHPSAPDLEAAVRSLAGAVPSAAPGTRFQYIDTDYQALALVMEKTTGKPYADILNERIFRRLGMKSSTAWAPAAPPRAWASLFALPLPRSTAGSSFGATSGYVISCATDMGQYLAFLLGPEKFSGGPVPPRVVGTVFEAILPTAPYGYGFFLAQGAGGRIAYHDGSVEGFSSRIVLWPDDKTGIAVLAAQGSLLQSLIALPSLTDGAYRIMQDGTAARPFPLGRLYILIAIVAGMHLLALIMQTGGALRWTKEARDKAEAKGTPGPLRFAFLRCWAGIILRIAIVFLCPLAVSRALERSLTWSALLQLEPGLAVWCLFGCVFGILRNVSRLAWLRGHAGFRKAW